MNEFLLPAYCSVLEHKSLNVNGLEDILFVVVSTHYIPLTNWKRLVN